MENLEKEGIPKCLGYMEGVIKNSGKNGYAVGDSVSTCCDHDQALTRNGPLKLSYMNAYGV